MTESMNLKHFIRLKERVEHLQHQTDRAAGALEQLQAQLQKEFDCVDSKEGQELLARLERQRQVLEKEYQIALANFETKWKEEL